MADKLAALIRLHKWRLDEQRRTLADALRQLERLQRQSCALEAEIAAEQEAARFAPAEAGFAYARFAHLAVERRAACRQAIAAAEADVAAHRETTQARYRQLRTFELAEDDRRRRAEAEAARREGLALNEIALLARAPDAVIPRSGKADYSGDRLRALAAKTGDGRQARRLMALAAVADGKSPGEASAEALAAFMGARPCCPAPR
jgi:flagellar protein FliJ